MTDKPSSRTRTDKHCDGVGLLGEVWRSGEMEDSVYSMRRWEDLETDILVKIFQSFDVFELTSGIAHICSGWRLACCDPLLWKTLDLSMMQSNFIKIPLEPYVYVDGRSDKLLARLLKISMSLSRGNIMTLIFHVNLYVSDDQLTYTAERCPKLKRLVLPAWNRIKKTGICKAISCWKDLESLTMPSIANPPYFIEEIANNCRNFRELKIMGPCDIFFASTLVAYLPKLKVLSLRCSMLLREALLMILEGLPHLEVLNISHCLLIDISPPPASKRILREIDPFILEKASRLRRFFTCMQDSCLMCQRTKNDEGLMRWYKYEEGLWKEDESALSFGKGNITSLIVNLDLYVPDHLFTYTAERSRNLKRLVMLIWNRIQKAGIGKAIACWKDLESLTIGNIEYDNYLYLMNQISYNCKNLRELKLIGTCQLFAFILVTYLPKLRVLSLRCSKLSEEDLVTILDWLPDLKILNVSHCFVIRTPPERGVITQLDPVILGKASRLRRFITCMEFRSCIMCKRAREDEGIVRCYKYEQGLWKQDEVSSLAL